MPYLTNLSHRSRGATRKVIVVGERERKRDREQGIVDVAAGTLVGVHRRWRLRQRPAVIRGEGAEGHRRGGLVIGYSGSPELEVPRRSSEGDEYEREKGVRSSGVAVVGFVDGGRSSGVRMFPVVPTAGDDIEMPAIRVRRRR
ncbi:hypothetical protein K7X08_003306 [Anisodus acutangulus]|uniref:Uncharacterized protein n=1 Tax=Anisodus acutangulus TaxID=402998 RepID=A0A9Q1MDL0_9SOLA|nr:hypothetical protein K7X08_003306 [Anisodus acutangulus]